MRNEAKVAHIIALALVAIPENSKNLRRSLERDDRLRTDRIKIVSQGNQPCGQSGNKADLHGKVRLIRQLTSETVRGKLAFHIQTVLGKVSGKLVVQGLLFADAVSVSTGGKQNNVHPYVFRDQGVVRRLVSIAQCHDQLVTACWSTIRESRESNPHSLNANLQQGIFLRKNLECTTHHPRAAGNIPVDGPVTFGYNESPVWAMSML